MTTTASTTRTSDGIAADVTVRAIDALRNGAETFTRAQVAYLLALATESDNLAYEVGYRDGQDNALGDAFESVRYAFGGPTSKAHKNVPANLTMADAISGHIRDMEQRKARAAADAGRSEDRPHGLVLDDPGWPTVTLPGAGNLGELPGEWPCPCPRTRDGGHVTPKNDPGQSWRQPGQRRHLALVGGPAGGAR